MCASSCGADAVAARRRPRARDISRTPVPSPRGSAVARTFQWGDRGSAVGRDLLPWETSKTGTSPAPGPTSSPQASRA